jgi:hypothetical protein
MLRQLMWWFRSTLLATAATAVVAVGCGDDDSTKTLNVVAPSKGVSLNTVDLGSKGSSPGDYVVFDGPLLDGDEQHDMGQVYGTQTAIALRGDTEIVQAMITYDLGGGDKLTIGGTGEYPRGETGLKQSRQFERPIVGGTGQYAGARGTVTSVRRADGAYEHTFHIED